ncbi:deoxyribodipyrimidine photo-lyase [bacterium]|nr:MAG: deoxyribodipyrimidine photo-lyase [bacterium]
MKTTIVWFRNDLRVHDHPALAKAVSESDSVIPLFIIDDALMNGGVRGSNRNRFLLESLTDLRQLLQAIGGDLVIRRGKAVEVLQTLVNEHHVDAVYYTADYTPYSIKRDKTIESAFKDSDTTVRGFAGRLIVSSIDKLNTKSGTPHKVFTPFWRNWQTIQRRTIAQKPSSLRLPSNIAIGELPKMSDITLDSDLSPSVLQGGESAGRKRLDDFLKNDIKQYSDNSNNMAADATSRLSAYLHFGCISPREIETMLPDNKGAAAWHRQLCWRDFYHYVLFHHPHKDQEFQERYRDMQWGDDEKLLSAWQQGKTGYPVVDAAMRQLNQEGWMHNRARLIVGSFLVKDLWIDWRLGEAYFMKMLIDGDTANNNGNWQWIASVGVDPAPVFRRLYNPSSQAKNYDPNGDYVHRYVPELKDVPLKYLAEPWTMTMDQQREYNCVLGSDYPEPIVDHKQARLAALERYRQA